jgi:hypothetical protein
MEQKNDGGAAFPQHGWSRDPEANKYMQDKGGMSLRDYFAAQALTTIPAYSGDDVNTWAPDDFARHAYSIADAMLAERAK